MNLPGEKVKCFDIRLGHLIKELNGHFRQVNCCHYNPSTQEVYSGSNDRNILVWTPDHAAEDVYLDLKRNLQSNSSAPGSVNANSSSHPHPHSFVLADTWSDSDDG